MITMNGITGDRVFRKIDMLDEPNRIDWERLGGSLGKAVPRLIRDLASKDPQVRVAACRDLVFELSGLVGDPDLSIYVIPFVIDLLSNYGYTDTDKKLLLELLYQLVDDSWGRLAAHDAIGQAKTLYMQLLEDDDPEIRILATQILCHFPEHASQIVPALNSNVAREQVAYSKAEAIWQVAWLISKSEDINAHYFYVYINTLKKLISDSNEPFVTFVSAIALSRLLTENAPPQVDNILINGIVNPNQYPSSPYHTHDVGWYDAYDALWDLGFERALHAFGTAIELAPHPFASYIISTEFLNRVFEPVVGHNDIEHPFAFYFSDEWSKTTKFLAGRARKEPRDIGKMSANQIRVLLVVLQNNKLFSCRNNLLELYGLPGRNKLLRLLKATPLT